MTRGRCIRKNRNVEVTARRISYHKSVNKNFDESKFQVTEVSRVIEFEICTNAERNRVVI